MVSKLIEILGRAQLEGSDRWSLTLEGEDPRDFLIDLVRGLKGEDRPDKCKRIPNKHRYVGLGPTLSWLLACRDPSYPVMYDSLGSFARLWDPCQARIGVTFAAYVSFGVGTGDKDRHILDRLSAANSDLVYLPVDISTHMLKLGLMETIRRFPGYVLPVELDFERPSSLRALRRLLGNVAGDRPILFSLLGSSLANIENDVEFLGEIGSLLREQDRLVLEVAVTDRLDVNAANAAAAERSDSRLYNEFATSALAVYTDLTINLNWLRFEGAIEQDRALRVQGYYINFSDKPISIALPNREVIPFIPGEKIEVLLGRKYALAGLESLYSSALLGQEAAEYEPERDTAQIGHANTAFGLAVSVLRRTAAPADAQLPLTRLWQTG